MLYRVCEQNRDGTPQRPEESLLCLEFEFPVLYIYFCNAVGTGVKSKDV